VTNVSVYIPAYNVAKFLAPAIESLLTQSLPPDEILIIDDGSKDETPEIARRYPRVTLVCHDVNRGLAAARNTAFRAAGNELVASLDADCVADPSWLAELVRNLTDPRVAGIGGKLTEGIQRTVADRWRAIHMPQHWGDEPMRNPAFLFGCNNLFRKSAVLSVGGYDERMRTNGEDIDICARLREKGWEFLYTPSAQATHMRQDTTASILATYWRWWRFGVNAYAQGPRLRSVLGHAVFVHFRYNFLNALRMDVKARRWELAAFDFLIPVYFPYRDFRLWLSSKKTR